MRLLFMTHKTAASEGLHAVLVDVFFYMALRAVIHLHAVPWIALNSGHISAPDITTVAGNTIFFIDF